MKRISAHLSALLFCLAILLSSCSAGDVPASGVTGDLDGDGAVTEADLSLLLSAIEKKDPADSKNDINMDGVLDNDDAELLRDYLSGVYSKLPANCAHPKFEVVTLSSGRVQSCKDCGFRRPVQDMTGTKVAYIPIDNRPVNQERVIYLAQAVGIDLLMPEEDLYRTALDNMTPNKNGTTFGDREKLLRWLKDVDRECDYFVISLDQVFSGGLVESRWASNTDLTFEYEVADEIIRLCETNTVVLFDTVMRLASTVKYHGYAMDEYNALREYGRTARKTLSGDGLTVNDIISGYRYHSFGDPIKTDLSEEQLEKYHASRARKLKLIDYVLRNAGETMDSIYVGVDDSSPQTTIQTNEINYIRNLMGDRGVLSAGTDELGLCSLTRMITLLYGQAKANVIYYGPGKNKAADAFDIGTLNSTIRTHLRFMNTTISNDADALQILILTSDFTASDLKNMVARIKTNLANNVPTCLLDVSGEQLDLGAELFEKEHVDVAKLLGYSSWNTASNAIGISLSNAIGRYLYLHSVSESTDTANAGFLRTVTFSYIKDLSYIAANGRNPDGIMGKDSTCCVMHIVQAINGSPIITSLVGYEESVHQPVSVSNFRSPWSRTFEATFDIALG